MLNRSLSMYVVAILVSCASYVAALEFDWAEIGNAGNAADDTGFGVVDHSYAIATTEVTISQYIEFLNDAAASDPYGLYNERMSTSSGGITRSGSSGSYTYSLRNADTTYANKPEGSLNFYDVLRFINWLNTGDTETGAYHFSNGTLVTDYYNGELRNPDALYWLPTEDEWYKAAYYDPSQGIYYDYATGSDTIPDNNDPANDTGNSANYMDGVGNYAIGLPYYRTDVGAYTDSASPYGTFDQNGNVEEWVETLEGIIRGGAYPRNGSYLNASVRIDRLLYDDSTHGLGFRVATVYTETTMIPEPMTMLLMAAGLLVRFVVRRRG